MLGLRTVFAVSPVMPVNCIHYIDHETAICHNLLIHSFTGGRKKLDCTLINQHLRVCFYKYKEKQRRLVVLLQKKY